MGGGLLDVLVCFAIWSFGDLGKDFVQEYGLLGRLQTYCDRGSSLERR